MEAAGRMIAAQLIVAATGFGEALEKLGVPAAALLAAGAVLMPSVRGRATTALAALAVTPVLLLADIWGSSQVQSLRDRPGLLLAGIAVGLLVLAGLAVLMTRRPELTPLLAVAALPFRVPISAGGSTANLLLPLYLVIAAGVLAHAVPRVRGRDDDAPHAPGALEWLLCALVVLYGLQAAYSSDFAKALQNVAFFYVPFMLLFALLRDVRWSARLAKRCLAVLGALALAFIAVGFYEYATKRLLLNPKVITANQFESYFRVNSLFFDPNVYGRFLALVMLAVATVVLWARRGRDVWLGAIALAVLWGGLIVTFSQSSFAALLVGLAVLAAHRWSARWTLLVAAGAVVAGIAFVAIAPGAVRLDLGSSKSADRATSGRADLIAGGGRLFTGSPVWGHGSGSFAREYRRGEKASDQKAVSASHTIPVTFAAEQGVIGLLVYLALLAAAFMRLGRGARSSPLRVYVLAAFAALVVHTMLYAAFLEDPLSWALLAVGVALAGGEDGGVREPPVPEPEPELSADAAASP